MSFLWSQREGDPLNQGKKGRGRNSEKRNFQPEWFFQMKSKRSQTQWSPFFFLFTVCVCVDIHRGLVGGGLPFKECPAVDVFGICGPCPSIVHSPQWLQLSWRWAPVRPLVYFFFVFVFTQLVNQGVKSETEIMSDSSPPPTCPWSSFSFSLYLFVHICLLASRPRGSQHGCWALLLTKLADWQLNMFLT